MFTIDHYAGVPFIIVSRLVDTHILFLWLWPQGPDPVWDTRASTSLESSLF